MRISPECTALVTAWEGLPDGDPSTVNFDPYMDPVAVWTIGYGRALRDPQTGNLLKGMGDRKAAFAQFPGGISRLRAIAMLAEDLAGEETKVGALMRPDAGQAQFDALVSFNFNTGSLGASTLRKLHMSGSAPGTLTGDASIAALAGAVRTKQVTRPADLLQGFAVWSFGKGAFLGGLFCRRLAEWTLYRGATAAEANAFGAHVRDVIAH
ncbi:lysozyme [Sphingosinicellaceae bacterium]|nr:lysozyme [Sphingosinicellaceae bacterium]